MSSASEIPRGNAAGFVKYFRYDIVSGLLVFLIALPLCLAISLASGYPPLAGIFTAIIGGLLTTFISNSELTIKGPAAGLIVIVVGAIESFGGDGFANGVSPADMSAYRCALAVGVVAAVLQVVFGIVRAGILGEFFPVSAVHGMLAAIGVIIISKQIPVALGLPNKGEPLELLRKIPEFIASANPAIALIGGVSVAIMFLWPVAQKRVAFLRIIPGPMVVLLVAIPLGMYLDLLHEHSYTLQNHQYQLSDQFLVAMPKEAFGMFKEVNYPDFTVLTSEKYASSAWYWVFMFFIIGTLESMLSCKAVDLIDPWRRKTNLNRDIVAVGCANLGASLVGGLPMISEIVRSRANIDNGARTRFSDFWHGMFLLVCVALIPMYLHLIPQAALAAMLIYTGSRLAHPKEFMHVFHIGREQLLIFVSTIIGVLATDLLIGIGIGIGVKFLIHLLNGVPISSLFKPYVEAQDYDENTTLLIAHKSAVFSNWIPFRRQLEQLCVEQGRNVIVDLSDTELVDHSVMEKLHEMQRDYADAGLSLTIRGLDTHLQLSGHQTAARKRGRPQATRLTITVRESVEPHLRERILQAGAFDYSIVRCFGHASCDGHLKTSDFDDRVRIEALFKPSDAQTALSYLKDEVSPAGDLTVTIMAVDVAIRPGFNSASESESLSEPLAGNGSLRPR